VTPAARYANVACTTAAGAKADLVLFDPAKVKARADYVHSTVMAEGFDLVVVNGEPAYEDGKAAGRAGRLLRRGDSGS
jgi:N-acyl-D-aspartate/D-glutamate deacylase